MSVARTGAGRMSRESFWLRIEVLGAWLLALVWLVRVSRVTLPAFAPQIPVYAMGVVSAAWRRSKLST